MISLVGGPSMVGGPGTRFPPPPLNLALVSSLFLLVHRFSPSNLKIHWTTLHQIVRTGRCMGELN